MDIPELSLTEYEALTDGYDVDTYWLTAVEVEQLYRPDWNQPERRGLHVQFLNVTEPHEYRTSTGHLLVILPIGDPVTYDMIDLFWPSMISPFAYIVRENLYDELDDIDIYFRYGQDQDDGGQRLPAFDLNDWRTR